MVDVPRTRVEKLKDTLTTGVARLVESTPEKTDRLHQEAIERFTKEVNALQSTLANITQQMMTKEKELEDAAKAHMKRVFPPGLTPPASRTNAEYVKFMTYPAPNAMRREIARLQKLAILKQAALDEYRTRVNLADVTHNKNVAMRLDKDLMAPLLDLTAVSDSKTAREADRFAKRLDKLDSQIQLDAADQLSRNMDVDSTTVASSSMEFTDLDRSILQSVIIGDPARFAGASASPEDGLQELPPVSDLPPVRAEKAGKIKLQDTEGGF